MVRCRTSSLQDAITITLFVLSAFTVQARRYRVNVRSCGLSQPIGKIINGNEIAKVQVPWLVKILMFPVGRNARFCGGSIITRNVVLTAAHCVYKRGQAAKEIRVFFNTTVGNKGPCIRVERGVIHEKYLSAYKGYDIALLKLEQTLPKFNRFVRPICLPRKYERTDEGPMLLAGYGTTNFKNKVPRHIMYYFTNALTEEKCDKALVKHWPSLRLSSSKVLCSWNPHQLAWMGDSGSPVTKALPNGKSVQYGIVSFVTTGKKSRARTVHTRVSPFRLWINEHLRNIDEWEYIVTNIGGDADGSCLR
ncbi:chymotrypsin-1-like [Amblyomma americanum]